MRRADRLFDIIQTLRVAPRPVTARKLAERLEVAERAIYRDIATLQARRVPIEGAAGLGYVLRRGFELPPLMFTADEIDAIAVGARMVRRLRDPGLAQAAESVLAKLATALPDSLRRDMMEPPFWVSEGSTAEPRGIDLAALRAAIRDRRKLHMTYEDAAGRRTDRVVWPIAMAYYVDATLLGAWCEKRKDYRHFRVERVLASTVLEERFEADPAVLQREWLARLD
ncbi:YafY family transcriptional regulator [Siccirubricoccus sp. KC 17139]|uniref:YafY family transcriptional regulator n=1 Tax=Siccirubricoccus soli TaxID=2899147 RepID=A0ABT1DFC7_9PROT|nr:YafY family protein [Siccirubricoccus soli]MCO6419655.1 YafY family transcriptional regulator [Siccirubricoccus soli]MCP2685790.1 YafY family transcriptional regulator [Siccirubricoccus soli]